MVVLKTLQFGRAFFGYNNQGKFFQNVLLCSKHMTQNGCPKTCFTFFSYPGKLINHIVTRDQHLEFVRIKKERFRKQT